MKQLVISLPLGSFNDQQFDLIRGALRQMQEEGVEKIVLIPHRVDGGEIAQSTGIEKEFVPDADGDGGRFRLLPVHHEAIEKAQSEDARDFARTLARGGKLGFVAVAHTFEEIKKCQSKVIIFSLPGCLDFPLFAYPSYLAKHLDGAETVIVAGGQLPIKRGLHLARNIVDYNIGIGLKLVAEVGGTTHLISYLEEMLTFRESGARIVDELPAGST